MQRAKQQLRECVKTNEILPTATIPCDACLTKFWAAALARLDGRILRRWPLQRSAFATLPRPNRRQCSPVFSGLQPHRSMGAIIELAPTTGSVNRILSAVGRCRFARHDQLPLPWASPLSMLIGSLNWLMPAVDGDGFTSPRLTQARR
jgi:hypothetical protein